MDSDLASVTQEITQNMADMADRGVHSFQRQQKIENVGYSESCQGASSTRYTACVPSGWFILYWWMPGGCVAQKSKLKDALLWKELNLSRLEGVWSTKTRLCKTRSLLLVENFSMAFGFLWPFLLAPLWYWVFTYQLQWDQECFRGLQPGPTWNCNHAVIMLDKCSFYQ